MAWKLDVKKVSKPSIGSKISPLLFLHSQVKQVKDSMLQKCHITLMLITSRSIGANQMENSNWTSVTIFILTTKDGLQLITLHGRVRARLTSKRMHKSRMAASS